MHGSSALQQVYWTVRTIQGMKSNVIQTFVIARLFICYRMLHLISEAVRVCEWVICAGKSLSIILWIIDKQAIDKILTWKIRARIVFQATFVNSKVSDQTRYQGDTERALPPVKVSTPVWVLIVYLA